MADSAVYEGAWWCPTCSRALDSTLDTNHGEPCCPKCGGRLEEQGQDDGDDSLGYDDGKEQA